jgi:micrococcal nuclease
VSQPGRKNRGRSSRSASPATIAIIIFAVLAMLRILVFRPELPTTQETTRERVWVDYVIDGDTFVLTGGTKVRLLGIDAPEAGFGGSNPEFFAEQSTTWLRKRIEQTHVSLRTDSPERDRYDRVLAWVYDESGELINVEILREGQAKLLDDFGLPLDLEESLRTAESEARLLKRGLWAGATRTSSPSTRRK